MFAKCGLLGGFALGLSAFALFRVTAGAAPRSIPGGAPVVLRAGSGTQPFRIPPPQGFALRPRSATITINYLPVGTTNRYGDVAGAWTA